MMSQPTLCKPHGPTVPPSPRLGRPARPVAVVNVLGVADVDVVPLGVAD